jgi:DNA-binding response OmpR family regulator
MVIDDDPLVGGLLEKVLSADGFSVALESDGSAAVARVERDRPDLVLLDVMLGREDGFNLLTQLRRNSDVPVILLSGKGHENDRILGLRLGADDYVVKPFSPGELSARVTTVLRRSSPPVPLPAACLEFESLRIDTTSREVQIADKPAELTAKEFDLLAFLASSPRQVFSRGQLLSHVWASSSEWQDPATVTEHVRRVRKKIERNPNRPQWLVTVRGVGYRFQP